MLPSTASENAAGGVTCLGFSFSALIPGVDMFFLGGLGLMGPSSRCGDCWQGENPDTRRFLSVKFIKNHEVCGFGLSAT
jgi:hypothetical protein